MKYTFFKTSLLLGIILSTGLIISCKKSGQFFASSNAKVYVANGEGGSLSVIDLEHNNATTTISLSNSAGVKYNPHNVQVAPDGKSVWASGTPIDTTEQDQLIVIDPATNKITHRISVGTNLDLVHVVLDNKSKNAFVTAGAVNKVFQVDANDYRIVRSFALGPQNKPHGMRYSNGKLYVANMGSKSMSIINVADGKITEVPMGGMAAQVAVTRNDNFIFISLYDTREVVGYNRQNGQLTRIQLPQGSQGPIQIYATPDSKLLYVADQGELMDRPISNKVYVIDIHSAKVVNTITVGQKAHGVVVSQDGKTAYVTNSAANTVSVIDVATQKVTTTVNVGEGPNGISYWYETGGMP